MQTTRLTAATALAALFWMGHAGAALAQDAEGATAEHGPTAEASSSSSAAADEESAPTVSDAAAQGASPPPLSEPAPAEPWERAPAHPRPRFAEARSAARASEPARSRRAQAGRSSTGWIAPVVIAALAAAAGLVVLAVALGDALSGFGSIGVPSYPLREEASPPSAARDLRLGVSPLAGGLAASLQLTF